MAHYTVQHTCGHTETHQILGPDPEWGSTTRRQHIADKRSQEPCSTCASAARDQQRATEAEAAAQRAADNGLPSLTGSIKQIAWAERIRSGALDEIRDRMTKAPADLAEQAMHIYTAIAARQTGASWWIDQRSSGDSINPRALAALATSEERATLADLAAQAKARHA